MMVSPLKKCHQKSSPCTETIRT